MGEIFVNALERKRMEEQINESEREWQRTFDAIANPVMLLDREFRILRANAATNSFLNLPADQVLGNCCYPLVHGTSECVPGCPMEVALKSQRHEEAEVYDEKRGIWLHVTVDPLLDKSGNLTGAVHTLKNITESKQAEAARMEITERHRAVVETFDGFIYICSPDYRVEFMNQRMIGRTGRNAVGELCYTALHDLDSICPWCVNEQVFRGETVRWEVQSPKDHRWYYVVNTPLRHADGTISKQAMIMDIHERKLAEETLRQSESALRNSQKDLRRLAGRLISAQEEELRRLSRELHDDLTQRLAVLAIEAGKLELELKEEPGSLSAPSQKIGQIKEQLIKVSEDVHHISRQLHPSILDDLGLVRAIESQCLTFFRREQIQITFLKENVPSRIPADIALCLYRVVQESLRNIIRHSQAGGAEIFLKGADDSISLTIEDAGIGFDPLEVRHKPGLGLASMRERAQLVQGDFSIKSQPGQGTVISIRVPLTGGGE